VIAPRDYRDFKKEVSALLPRVEALAREHGVDIPAR
jgi:hypothetical protein